MVERVGAFFQFRELCRIGLSRDEAVQEMVDQEVKDSGERFSRGTEGIFEELMRRAQFRKEDGEKIAGEVEDGVDITGPARERIEVAKESHKKVIESGEETLKLINQMSREILEGRKERELLRQKLEYERRGLEGTGDPRWISLEELRGRGRLFAGFSKKG
mgnify:CR=1 FL=1